MASRPWIKFYPADWQADQALGMCSLAARGLWLEMLAIMHRADPYGHLLVNGKVPTDTQLAALARCPLDQIPSLLDELESAGVFSKGRNRVIYSRRLTRDEKHRKDGATAQILNGYVPGSRRWQAAEKQAQKQPPPRVVAEVVEMPPPDSYARSHMPEKKKNSPNGEAKEKRFRLPPDFDRPAEWLDDAARARERHHLPPTNLELRWERFFNWSQGGSPNAVKSNWHLTWINWCLDDKPSVASTQRTFGAPGFG